MKKCSISLTIRENTPREGLTEERVKWSNVYLIDVPKEKRENGAETIFEKLMAETTETDLRTE